MGRFREQLIRILACVVAIDLAAGVVALYARTDTVSTVSAEARTPNPTAPSAAPTRGGTATQSGGILAGGTFTKRRSSKAHLATEAAAGTTATSAPAAPSTATGASSRPSAVSTGASSSGKARTPAPASPGTGAPAAGKPATTPASGPGSPAASPAPTSTETGEPAAEEGSPAPSAAAPADPTTTGKPTPAKTSPPSTTSGVWTVISDGSGDTVLDGSQAPQANAQADIVEVRATNTTKAIGFAVKVAQPVDPTRDPNWASGETFVSWEVDTTGDGTPDFEVQYFVEGGKLAGGVMRAGDNGASVCGAEAGFMSDNYVVGVDPACLGSPASMSFRATTYYDTEPKTDDAGVVTDVAPDGGLSGPVARTTA